MRDRILGSSGFKFRFRSYKYFAFFHCFSQLYSENYWEIKKKITLPVLSRHHFVSKTSHDLNDRNDWSIHHVWNPVYRQKKKKHIIPKPLHAIYPSGILLNTTVRVDKQNRSFEFFPFRSLSFLKTVTFYFAIGWKYLTFACLHCMEEPCCLKSVHWNKSKSWCHWRNINCERKYL